MIAEILSLEAAISYKVCVSIRKPMILSSISYFPLCSTHSSVLKMHAAFIKNQPRFLYYQELPECLMN